MQYVQRQQALRPRAPFKGIPGVRLRSAFIIAAAASERLPAVAQSELLPATSPPRGEKVKVGRGNHVNEPRQLVFYLNDGTSTGGAVKSVSCGRRHNAQKYIQNPKYKSTRGGLCYSCYDEELFQSGSRRAKEAERVFPNNNVAKLLHVFPRDESLVHFSLGAPTNTSSACFAFRTLAAAPFAPPTFPPSLQTSQ